MPFFGTNRKTDGKSTAAFPFLHGGAGHHWSMRRPEKTEMEFFLLMVPIGVPFAYYTAKALLAFVGS